MPDYNVQLFLIQAPRGSLIRQTEIVQFLTEQVLRSSKHLGLVTYSGKWRIVGSQHCVSTFQSDRGVVDDC